MILTRGIGVGGPLVTTGLGTGFGLEQPQVAFDYLRGAADERAYAARHDVSDRPHRPVPEIQLELPKTPEEIAAEVGGEQPSGRPDRAPRPRRERFDISPELAEARAALDEAMVAGRTQAEIAFQKARERARERALSRQRQRELELIALAAMADDED